MLAGAILGIILIFKLTGHGPEKPQNLPDDNPSYVFAWALGSLFKLGAGGLVGGILGGITEKIYKHVKSTHHSE